MDIEFFREYCIAKKGVTESFPFGEDTLVFKVCDKMFALTGVDSFTYINLKCEPEKAIDLRERYTGIRPGYHMSKVHWNSVYTNEDVPQVLITELIDLSYDLVVQSLPKYIQNELAGG